MVRKTKEDAELTRQRIICAARVAFLARGVSRTTMEHIASQAGMTRGAVYWHFENKTQLFQTMREQVFLPLIDRMDDQLLNEHSSDPLALIEEFMCTTLQQLNDSIETREIYEIMMIKCEYVDDFASILQQMLQSCSGITDRFVTIYERAQAKGQLIQTLSPQELALDSNLFFGGLLNMWVKDTTGTNYRMHAQNLIKAHIRLRRQPNGQAAI